MLFEPFDEATHSLEIVLTEPVSVRSDSHVFVSEKDMKLLIIVTVFELENIKKCLQVP